MKKMKIAIILIAVALIGGLGTFVFANGRPEELEKKPNSIKKVEDKKDTNIVDDTKQENKDEENQKTSSQTSSSNKTTTNIVANTNKNVKKEQNNNKVETEEAKEEKTETNNKPSTNDNDNYKLALEYIIKAETSLDINDLYKAEILIKKLPNTESKKELETRLEDTNNIIETRALVTKLVDLVENAKNKNDMNLARDLKNDLIIEDKVASLKNPTIKNELTNKLNTISKKLNDSTNPIITGILNNNYYQNISNINIEDESNYIIKLNNNIVSLEDIKDLTEGFYTLSVIDESFNESNITFTIDKTKPIISFENYKGNNIYHESVTPIIADNNIDKILLNNEIYQIGTPISAYNNYTLVAIDKAGNESQVEFTIRKIKVNIEIEEPNDLVYNGQGKEFKGKLIDEYGNTVEGKVEISYNGQKEYPVDAGTVTVNFYYAGSDIYEKVFISKKYEIAKANYEVEITAPTNLYYDNTKKEYKATLKDVSGNTKEISVVYKDKDNNKLEEAPIESGKYKAIIYDKGNNNYNGVYKEINFTINEQENN